MVVLRVLRLASPAAGTNTFQPTMAGVKKPSVTVNVGGQRRYVSGPALVVYELDVHAGDRHDDAAARPLEEDGELCCHAPPFRPRTQRSRCADDYRPLGPRVR